jgi:hypothetical protein
LIYDHAVDRRRLPPAKEKLALMEARSQALLQRAELEPGHRAEVERSYRDMMRKYRRDIKHYEAAHGIKPETDETGPAPGPAPDEAPECAEECFGSM